MMGGEHEWWNIHSAKFPNEHQSGIHGTGSAANELFDGGNNLWDLNLLKIRLAISFSL